jgi:hypothetical protein
VLGSGFKKLNPTLRFVRRVDMFDWLSTLGEEPTSIDDVARALCERSGKDVTYFIDKENFDHCILP